MQIAVVDRFANLGSTMQVVDALAQYLPVFLLFGIPLTGPEDPELVRAIEGRLHTRHALPSLS